MARAVRVPSDSAPTSVPTRAETAPLTAAIARGDTGAFAAFYEAWFDRAYALTRSISRRDESFCMDTTQEVMLRVAKGMPALRNERAVAAWMGRTVFTTVADRLRRERRRCAHERRAAERVPTTVGPPSGPEERERIQWLREQLAALAPHERLLLLERFGNDRTLVELGDALGTTGNAVHGRIRRALTRLRAKARRWNDDQS